MSAGADGTDRGSFCAAAGASPRLSCALPCRHGRPDRPDGPAQPGSRARAVRVPLAAREGEARPSPHARLLARCPPGARLPRLLPPARALGRASPWQGRCFVSACTRQPRRGSCSTAAGMAPLDRCCILPLRHLLLRRVMAMLSFPAFTLKLDQSCCFLWSSDCHLPPLPAYPLAGVGTSKKVNFQFGACSLPFSKHLVALLEVLLALCLCWFCWLVELEISAGTR